MNVIKIRIVVFSLLLLFFINLIYAQKKDIDSTVFYKWANVINPMISPNGNYVLYYIQNDPVGLNTLVIKSLTSKWAKEIVCLKMDYSTLIDNKQAVFFKGNDSLGVITLGRSVIYYAGIKSFKLSNVRNSEWIAAFGENKLTLIKDGKFIIDYKNIINYQFVLGGKSILIQTYDMINGRRAERVIVADLETLSSKEIWTGSKIEEFKLNKDETKMAFLATPPSKNYASNEVILYDLIKREVDTIVNNTYRDLKISNIRAFSRNDKNILISLCERDGSEYKESNVKLKVWGYMDQKIQSKQIEELGRKLYLGSISIEDKRIVKLEMENDEWYPAGSPENWGDKVLISRASGDCNYYERSWNPACSKKWYLLDVGTGTRKEITQLAGKDPDNECILSPDSKFIVYYDREFKAFFSYNIATRVIANISKRVVFSTDSVIKQNHNNYIPSRPRGIAGWHKGDKSVLIYDDNDIWIMDPTGQSSPYNLTKGYGLKHDIVFSFPGERGSYIISALNEEIILTALNLTNKDNGFYKTKLGNTKDPELLIMEPYIYYLPFGGVNANLGMKPVKAKDANVFIVQRESSGNSPNYFSTTDFKTFKTISEIYPEKQYNWPSSELHTWKLPDGKTLQGVLYKPENFDSTKKYPIIFNIYERFSNSLNGYFAPDPLCDGCNVNPIVLASKGYLVFKPDIYYKYNEPGESALRAVLSAINHLRQYSWIDTNKMGLQGCSMGGFETNYIVTHSNLFKAVCTASGMSDFVSYSSNLCESVYTAFNLGQFRINKMVWEDPSIITGNSAIFNANRVKAPLLLFHTNEDVGSRLNQAIQFYLILRKLKKKVWLLEYDDANHGLTRPEQVKDFSLRMLQFFDHYLRDEPAPKWMIRGVRAKDASSDTGLDLDSSGVTP
jgi:dienelactone hydrolase